MFREMKRSVVTISLGVLFVVFFFALLYSESEVVIVEHEHLKFRNPLLNSNDSVGKKTYRKLVTTLPDNEIDALMEQFDVKGTEYLSPENKRNFLWCDAELRTGQPLKMFERACTEVGFKKDTGKKVALASFPGSGSTWSRTLLEQATGVFTGAIYCDRYLKAEGFVGEYITTGNVIAIKTHSCRITKIKYDAAIFIVRHLADALKSEINRRSSHKNHTGIVDESEYDNGGVLDDAFLIKYSDRYLKTVSIWLDGHNIPVIVVKYEDILRDTRTQLRRMLDFLEFPYTEERLDCVMNHQVQTFHRKHAHNFDPFSPALHHKISQVMEQAEPLLNKYNVSYK